MKLGVLGSCGGWHLGDLRRAACDLDIDVVALDHRHLRAELTRDAERLFCGVENLGDLDAVLVRAMPAGSLEQVVFRMDVLHRLESCGTTVVNAPRAIECAVDKYLALSRVGARGLPVPETVTCEQATEALDHFRRLNDLNPGRGVVVKPLFGSEGRGLRRVREIREARATFAELEAEGSVFYLQEFIPHPGWDLRALVIGRRIVSCMRRRAVQENEWRTNISLGGSGEVIDADETVSELALKASEAVGTQIAGIDLVPDASGSLRIVEVNAAPGWRELAAVSASDIAREILVYVRETNAGDHESKNEPRRTSLFVRPKI